MTQVVSGGGSSTTALTGSTEEAQFNQYNDADDDPRTELENRRVAK